MIEVINIKNMKIKLFADGADAKAMKVLYNQGGVTGFTTNPSLMRKAGVSNYENFAKEMLADITDLPISFEILSDDIDIMEQEAKKVASWGNNVYVKIPIVNTKGVSTVPLIKKLSAEGLKLNVTAILTLEQVQEVCKVLSNQVDSVVSIFAGRIADTGRDPIPYMEEAVKIASSNSKIEILWASTREVINIFQAEQCGCHIITVTNDILKKLTMINKDLNELSVETVKMFFNDSRDSGFTL